jgi:hypothetical protein
MSAVGHARQELGLLRTGGTQAHANLRRRILWIFTVTVLFDLAMAGLALLAERTGGHGTQIHNYWDAWFWATTQLLTVSSQMPNPVTTAGRVIDVMLETYAITVVASLAAMFGAFFHHRSAERGEHPHPAAGSSS